jgi:hypothetical protein
LIKGRPVCAAFVSNAEGEGVHPSWTPSGGFL